MYSKSVLVGNLARDPETRTAGDSKVTRLVVAVNDPYLKDKVSFIDAEAWGKLGEICEKYLEKGRKVLVDGRLVQDIWEKDGKSQSKIYVKADNVQFIGGRNENPQDSSKEESNSSSENYDDDVPF